jgi:hypothetical protein
MNLFQSVCCFRYLYTHTYLPVQQVIDRCLLLCIRQGVYTCTFQHLCLRTKADFFFAQSFKIHFLLAWYGAAKINHTRKVTSCWHA